MKACCVCGEPATVPMVCWDYISGDGWPSDVTLSWYCEQCCLLECEDSKWYSFVTVQEAIKRRWLKPEHPDWDEARASYQN